MFLSLRITYVTMGVPVVLLFVFLGKAVSLEGSQAGIKQYIGIWDVTVLSEKPEVWSEAVTQIFFSIGITFGILTAYGSHCKRDEPAVMNTVIVAISNSLFSFVAGFAVFAALGHLAFKEGVEVTSLSYAGFSLVFGTWPVVFNDFNNGIQWVRLLFFTLFLLGIDSAFAFQEAILSVLRDTVYFEHTPRWKLALGLCTTGYCFSLLYCTDAGLNFLDVIDYYINFVMILVGFFEAFGSAWAYGIEDQFEICGKPAVLSFMIANFGAVGVASGLWFGGLLQENNNAIWVGAVGGISFYLAGVGVTTYFLVQRLAQDTTEQKWSMASLFWELYMGNILALRARIQPVIGHVPFVWCILMKHFIPHILIVLFVNLAGSDNGAGEPNFGGYGSYVTYPFQLLGILTFVFTLFLFSVGLAAPDVYSPLALPQIKDDGDHTALEQEVQEDENGAADAEHNTEGDDDDNLKVSDQEPEEELGVVYLSV
jgi:solute carrier family 6 GABA transporter-like protein 1